MKEKGKASLKNLYGPSLMVHLTSELESQRWGISEFKGILVHIVSSGATYGDSGSKNNFMGVQHRGSKIVNVFHCAWEEVMSVLLM